MSRITFRIPQALDAYPDLYVIGYDQSRFTPESLKRIAPDRVIRPEAEAALKGFKATAGETSVHFSERGTCIGKQTMLLGVGERSKLDAAALREIFTSAFQSAKKEKAKHVYIEIVEALRESVSPYEFGRILAETATLVDHEHRNSKTEAGGYTPPVRFTTIDVCPYTHDDFDALEAGMKDGAAIGDAVNFAKDLVDAPADEMTPEILAAHAREVAKASNGAIKIKVYGLAALKRIKANGILAVGRASEDSNPARMIELTYEPKTAKKGVKLALVGKSITFDSGGLDIKTQGHMLGMKGDMAGGAAVLAAIQVIAALKLPISVTAILPATENMCGSRGYKDGNVIFPISGPSIEVVNTDAEGRITLADGIGLALKRNPTHIIVIATLTGALRTALGEVMAGAFGKKKHEPFTLQLIEAAEAVGEEFWELPACGKFSKANTSKVADQKNSGGSFGAGASTAASFVLAYTGNTQAVHLDIANKSMDGNGIATGFGVRTLIEIPTRLST